MKVQKKNMELIKDIIEWDIVNWSKAIDYWESHIILEDKNYKCLELGGRRGGLSLWLALKNNHVICSDLYNPKDSATDLHNKYQVNSRINYEAIDATQIHYKIKF
jgi:2-polyprenyl-3-methyl-5-hydroxy-6-metoxy-1,4-benzoquinol methylase